MLITELKNKETILSLAAGKVFIINCHGCKEVHFPEKEANDLQKELKEAGTEYVVGALMVGDKYVTCGRVDILASFHCYAHQSENAENTTPPVRRIVSPPAPDRKSTRLNSSHWS